MTTQLNEESYMKLISDDIRFIEDQIPDHFLEKDHIIEVLRWSINNIYQYNIPPLCDLDFKKMRKNKGLTLRKVEEKTGISNSYLSQLETGKIMSPSYNVVRTLCLLLK